MNLLSKSIVNLNHSIPVYDLESSALTHNFCLSNGVVVHNCNSKDISDSIAGAVYNLYQDIDHAGQLSNRYKVSTYSKQMEERGRKEVDTFQSMLSGLYS